MSNTKKGLTPKHGFQTDYGHFRITFSNGYTVSLFNSFGSHTDNKYNSEKSKGVLLDNLPCDSSNIEVAVIYEHEFVTNMFVKTMDGEVAGWIRPEEVVEIMQKVSKEIPFDEIISKRN